MGQLKRQREEKIRLVQEPMKTVIHLDSLSLLLRYAILSKEKKDNEKLKESPGPGHYGFCEASQYKMDSAKKYSFGHSPKTLSLRHSINSKQWLH